MRAPSLAKLTFTVPTCKSRIKRRIFHQEPNLPCLVAFRTKGRIFTESVLSAPRRPDLGSRTGQSVE